MRIIQAYRIDRKYTQYLRQFTTNVKDEHIEDGRRHYLRPYVNLMVEINGMPYFFPLTSPKAKHKGMNRDGIDFVRLQGGQLGIINLNNMIPIPKEIQDKVLIPINKTITKYDTYQEQRYKILLQQQIASLYKVQNLIMKKAPILYKLYTGEYNNPPMHEKMRERCAPFPLLEQKALEYPKWLEQQQEQEKTQQNNTKQNRAQFQQNVGTLLEAMEKADNLKVTIQIESKTPTVTQEITTKSIEKPKIEYTTPVPPPSVDKSTERALETESDSLTPKTKPKPTFHQISPDLYVCIYDAEHRGLVTKERRGYTAKIGKKRQPQNQWFKKERISSLKDAQTWCDKFYQMNIEQTR